MPVESRQVFEGLAKENADMLTCYLLAVVRDPDLADELFHDIFIAAWKRFDTYDPEKPFGTYLRDIAAKTLMAGKNKLSAGKLLYLDRDTLALLEVQFDRAARACHQKWDATTGVLNQCLDVLPKPSLDAVSLHYQRDHSCAEIAQRLGVEPKVVKRRLASSRMLLLDCIRSKLAESGSGPGGQ